MDRVLKKYILLIFIITFSCAMTIDEQIEAIKKAPESERVELMNNLKRKLVLMNQEEREKAITRLRDKMSTKESIKSSIEQPTNFINNIQSNTIEQNIQIIKSAEEHYIEEQYQVNHIKNNIPTDITPSQIEQNIPTNTTPSFQVEQQNIPVDTVPTEPQQTLPSTNTTPTTELQHVEEPSNITPIEQQQTEPTNMTVTPQREQGNNQVEAHNPTQQERDSTPSRGSHR
jgi:hypothetical protein